MMGKTLNLKSRVPEGKYKATTINDKLIFDRKEIIDLIKKGYLFSSEVMEKAGFIKHVREIKTSISIVEHEKDERTYEKDTADIKAIIRSISTLDNGSNETIIEDDENKDEYEE